LLFSNIVPLISFITLSDRGLPLQDHAQRIGDLEELEKLDRKLRQEQENRLNQLLDSTRWVFGIERMVYGFTGFYSRCQKKPTLCTCTSRLTNLTKILLLKRF
jgi:hypothetical protein